MEALDGQLLVLSPWVVRNQRFDEALVLDHGFDVDFGLQIRAAGRKLLVADLQVVHHRSLELIADLEVWVEAHIRVAEKWNGILSSSTDREASAPDHEQWKRRARVAEARREAARAIAFSQALLLDARVLESNGRWPRRPIALPGASPRRCDGSISGLGSGRTAVARAEDAADRVLGNDRLGARDSGRGP